MNKKNKINLQEIYDKYVKINNNEEYLNRYKKLPVSSIEEFIDKMNFPRIITLLEFERLVKKYDIKPENLLMYNGGENGDPELKFINPKKIHPIDYNTNTGENDLHTFENNFKNFDFILFAQTLEHVIDPFKCLSQLIKHLKPGGYVFTSVPVRNFEHDTPFHCYMGFTPIGLGAIFQQVGFEIVEIGQWGNSKYIDLMNHGRFWPTYDRLKKGVKNKVDIFQPFNILKDGTLNEFKNPVDAWILAKRPNV